MGPLLFWVIFGHGYFATKWRRHVPCRLFHLHTRNDSKVPSYFGRFLLLNQEVGLNPYSNQRENRHFRLSTKQVSLRKWKSSKTLLSKKWRKSTHLKHSHVTRLDNASHPQLIHEVHQWHLGGCSTAGSWNPKQPRVLFVKGRLWELSIPKKLGYLRSFWPGKENNRGNILLERSQWVASSSTVLNVDPKSCLFFFPGKLFKNVSLSKEWTVWNPWIPIHPKRNPAAQATICFELQVSCWFTAAKEACLKSFSPSPTSRGTANGQRKTKSKPTKSKEQKITTIIDQDKHRSHIEYT